MQQSNAVRTLETVPPPVTPLSCRVAAIVFISTRENHELSRKREKEEKALFDVLRSEDIFLFFFKKSLCT
jgi:hypothetical protein